MEQGTMTKYILQKFEEQNGDFSYVHQYLYEKSDYDKMSEIELLNSFFCTELTEADKDGDTDQYWDGGRLVWLGTGHDVTEAEYKILDKFI
jgi:hypothetical protein